MSEKQVNREHKDRLFRVIFREREALLSLYNAINDTDYTDSEDFVINTLENVIYISMKNDISFLISGEMNLYEHQSTWNPNMPYRNLTYLADLYAGYVAKHQLDIYGSRAIRLPTPQAVVFYNGIKDIPERMELKLSDLYEVHCDDCCLELKTLVLNINYGKNKEIMEKCQWLYGYAFLVDRIRYYETICKDLKEAVDRAIDECIQKGVLESLLREQRGEIMHSVLYEYDEQRHIENEKRWSYEDGKEDGIRSEKKQGIQILIQSYLELNISDEIIIEKLKEYYHLEEETAKEYIKKAKQH